MRKPSVQAVAADLEVERRQRLYLESMRVLLEGTSGVNCSEVGRLTGLAHRTIRVFIQGVESHPLTVEQIGWFIWRRMNRHVLLSVEDGVGHAASTDSEGALSPATGGDVRGEGVCKEPEAILASTCDRDRARNVRYHVET